MAYVYLLDLYTYTDERLAQAREGRDNAHHDSPSGNFEQGRIDALTEFQEYLRENFNPKLPRRIRESYFGKKN